MRRVVLLLLVMGCAGSERDRMTVSWTTSDSIVGNGRMVLPAAATWCASTSQVLLLAQAGDSGAAIRIRTQMLGPAEFPVVDTTASRSPAALVALRFIRGARVVQVGSDSGGVEITEASTGGALAGSWNAWFSDPLSQAPIEGRGTFRATLGVPDSLACIPPAPASEPADSTKYEVPAPVVN